jgi:hypothetical protein
MGWGRNLFDTLGRMDVVIKLPPEPRTYELAIDWRDHDHRGSG